MDTFDLMYEIVSGIIPAKYITIVVVPNFGSIEYRLRIKYRWFFDIAIACCATKFYLTIEYDPVPELNTTKSFNLVDPNSIDVFENELKKYYRMARTKFWSVMWPFWPIIKLWEAFNAR